MSRLLPFSRALSGAPSLFAGVCITLLGGSTAQAAGQVQLPSCAAIAASAVARQSWREGASPFGLAYGDWTPEDFTALASRVRHCGGDPAYVEYLATQHRHLIEEPKAARSARLGFEAELKAIPAGDPAAALAALYALSSRVQASSMGRGDKAGLEAGINNRWRGEMLRKEAQDRVQAEANAEPVLKALIAEVDATPATVAGRRRLAGLSSANRYRLPELSFPQQNRYAAAIDRRIAQIDRQLTLGKCASHTARMGLPVPMADYEVVGQLGMRMGEVVCRPS